MGMDLGMWKGGGSGGSWRKRNHNQKVLNKQSLFYLKNKLNQINPSIWSWWDGSVVNLQVPVTAAPRRGLLYSAGLCMYSPAQTWHTHRHIHNQLKIIKIYLKSEKSLYEIILMSRNYYTVNIFFYSASCI